MKGNTTRFDSDTVRDIEDVLEGIECVTYYRGCGREVQVDIDIENPDWGLPSDVHDFIVAFEWCITDFSHVSDDSITIYIGPRQ